ncbi:hypothetical protein PTSG_10930 [Salpingoeca rosetta]|uniref:Endonuclease/exonuclease/phosphatase domain-containing protein n=1 Tax=Salpingoeca rosetta (strain ATCC 50818 / BSB-021) TaxID=946362 RepID=F2URF1_SALR5|nr:uncharacterized protein PTSG_10930 [Salpingoeca rosetta]EGD80254.1 hypothetical protein PTSG_10930 [Salpingoeca rosetta]|eukprot:XP_004988316.1 hypothetical protein PTSG_10930 [Salpingoeca rosetta]
MMEDNFVLVHHTHDEDIEVAHQKQLLKQLQQREEKRQERLKRQEARLRRQMEREQGISTSTADNNVFTEGQGDQEEQEDDDDDVPNDVMVPELARNMYMHMLIRCNGRDVLLKREIDGPLPPTLARIAKKFKMKADDVRVDTQGASTPTQAPTIGAEPVKRDAVEQPQATTTTTPSAATAATTATATTATAPAVPQMITVTDEHAETRVDATSPTVGAAEDVYGNPINTNTKDPSKLSNYWAFRQGCALVLGDQQLPVYHHAPVVVSLFVRGFPMVGSMLHPMATLHNCTANTCKWAWYRTSKYVSHKVIERVDAFGQHANIEVSEADGDVLVATTRRYTPTADDIGHRLICMCTPVNELCAGIPVCVLVGSRDDTRINRQDFYTSGTDNNDSGNGNDNGSSVETPAARCQRLSRSVCEMQLHPVVLARHAFAQSRELSPGMMRVVSYNILHDMFCDGTFALEHLYPYLDPIHAKTNYRHRRIAEEIAGYLPDFVCLQEVGHAEFHEVLEPRLGAAGLHGVYANKISQQRWGMATFFRRERWSLLEAHRLNLTRQWRVHSTIASVASSQPALQDQLENSTTVAQLLLLQCADGSRHYDGQLLCVVNCHLFSHPMAPHVRVIQAAVIAAEIKDRFGAVPVIWCGDFNANPNAAVVQFLHHRSIEETHPVWAEGACITRFKSATKAQREANWHSVLGSAEVHMARSYFATLASADTQLLSPVAMFSYTDAHGAEGLAATKAFGEDAMRACTQEGGLSYQDFFGALVDLRLEAPDLFSALQDNAPPIDDLRSGMGSRTNSTSGGLRSRLASSPTTTVAPHAAPAQQQQQQGEEESLASSRTPDPALTRAAISSAALTVPSPSSQHLQLRDSGASTTSIVSLASRALVSGFGLSSFSMALQHNLELHCSVRQPTYSAGIPAKPEQVDYVFYTPQIQMRMEQPPTFAFHHIENGLPSEFLPSDHVASVVDFAWNRMALQQ